MERVEQPQISAVLPTLGRPTLVHAVESALQQEGVRVEAVVSVDGDKDLARSVRTQLPSECDVVWTGGAGLNAARNLGIRESTQTWVGLLDDDDTWDPRKTVTQLAMVNEGESDVLLASAVRTVPEAGPGQVRPKRGPRPGEPVADYLFRRRSLTDFKNGLMPSTWLAPRPLFVENPFDEADFSRHDDWAWLVTTQARHPFEVRLALEPLVLYRVLGADSASRKTKARASRAWIGSMDEYISPAARVDFMLTAVNFLALSSGGRAEAWTAFREALPSVRPQNSLAALAAMYRMARGQRPPR